MSWRRLRKRLTCTLLGHEDGYWGRCVRCGKDLVE